MRARSVGARHWSDWLRTALGRVAPRGTPEAWLAELVNRSAEGLPLVTRDAGLRRSPLLKTVW